MRRENPATSAPGSPVCAHPPSRAAWFTRFARWASAQAGRPLTFFVSVLVIAIWAVTGPLFHFSDTWQLMINTSTTIVTFLMVFLIQNTQNRDSQAIHMKLDELIRAKKGARNMMLNLDDLSDAELEQLRQSFAQLAEKAKRKLDADEGEGETQVIAIAQKK